MHHRGVTNHLYHLYVRFCWSQGFLLPSNRIPVTLYPNFSNKRPVLFTIYSQLPFRHLTLLWLPPKRARKLAWVPVVPFTPRNFKSLQALFRLLKSISRSDSQIEARLPTVVNCAGLKQKQAYPRFTVDTARLFTYWKWVKASVGSDLYSSANLARRSTQRANYHIQIGKENSSI